MAIQAITSSTSVTTTALSQMNSSSASSSTGKTGGAGKSKPSGPPPAAAGGTQKAASSTTSSSSTSAAKIYDKRDTNQDGTVSFMEELLYSLKNPPEDTQSQSTAASSSQLQTGLNAYRQYQQTAGNSTTSSLFTI